MNMLNADADDASVLDRGSGDLATDLFDTQTGLRLMNPAYAAPEQVRGDRSASTPMSIR